MRTKTIPGLFRTLIPFLLLLLLFSCKKTDTGTIESNTGKFFNIKRNVSFETLRCIAELKRQNEITGFIEDLVKQSGFAYWDKALVNRKAVSNAPSFSSSQVQGGDTLVFIPLVKENENYVDGFLFFRINGAIEVHLYRNNDFDKFPYGSMNSEILKSEKVVQMLMKLDESIFGKRKFSLSDTELFKSDLVQNDSIRNVPKSVEYNRDMLNFEWMSVCFDSYHCHGCPPNQCDLCPLCYSIECVSLPVLVGGSGGGNEWPAEPPTGGSGGGGSNPCPTCPPPNQNCTPNGNCVIGTQIIEGRLPCGGCGNGPIVILPVDPPSINQSIIDSLTGYPCAQSILQRLPSINAMTQSLIQNVFGVNDSVNIMFVAKTFSDTLLDGRTIEAYTNANGILNYKIQLNTYMLNIASQDYLVATIMHESIHAYLYYKKHTLDSLTFHQQFPLYDSTPTNMGQHLQMAASYVQVISDVIKSFNPSLNNSVDSIYANALAWGGLEKTPAFQNNINPSPSFITFLNDVAKFTNQPHSQNGVSVNCSTYKYQLCP